MKRVNVECALQVPILVDGEQVALVSSTDGDQLIIENDHGRVEIPSSLMRELIDSMVVVINGMTVRKGLERRRNGVESSGD